jgi:glutamate decarboxylase
MTPERELSPAEASLENLYRIFTVPEASDSRLARIDHEVTENLGGFLRDRIVAVEKGLEEIEADFASPVIPEQPCYVSDYTDYLMEKLVAHSVHTAAPGFIGHMATPLPYFMLPLARIMTALNQNLVKIETSKAFTPLERQVLAMLHQLVFNRDEAFYATWMHEAGSALGSFCSGGTIANITALWAARNRFLGPRPGFPGLSAAGLVAAMGASGYEGLAVLVSRRGHYSLGKAVDLLGIGRDNLIAIDTDADSRVDTRALRQRCASLEAARIKVLAVVGIAGTTETGSVDPLGELADIAAQYRAHFHVDAAWGGPTLFSSRYRPLLAGIERADSVTIDAHKQLYVPIGAGMVLFRDPAALSAIEHHAEYVLRRGSKDLGARTLEGSRPGMAMLVHAGLHIIGRRGYELLVEQNIERAQALARLIMASTDFELVTAPTLNILSYRYVPAPVQRQLRDAPRSLRQRINAVLDEATQTIQKIQRAAGHSFVSRTRIPAASHDGDTITVFRVVLANPMTSIEVLEKVLREQASIAASAELGPLWSRIGELH